MAFTLNDLIENTSNEVKKSGRPKKSDSDKATKKIMLYFTETQYDILEEKAGSINLSVKDYIKARL